MLFHNDPSCNNDPFSECEHEILPMFFFYSVKHLLPADSSTAALMTTVAVSVQ